MNRFQREYYSQMAKRGRLLPIRDNGYLRGILTFFVGNGNPDKYMKRDMWSIVEDEPEGDTIYIDHLLTDHKQENAHDSIRIWHNIKLYLKSQFKNIKKFKWTKRGGRNGIHCKSIE